MAEQIISPGVFTRENDLSFLPQGIGQIGAAIIGPTVKGPAFVPTVVRSFAEYQRRFGTLSNNTFVPQTVREYLRNAGSVTVCRVLAGGGYTYSNGTTEPAFLIAGTGVESVATAASGAIKLNSASFFHQSQSATEIAGGYSDDMELQLTVGSGTYRFIGSNPNAVPEDSTATTGPFFFATGSADVTATNLVAELNSVSGSTGLSASLTSSGTVPGANSDGFVNDVIVFTSTNNGASLNGTVTVKTGSGNFSGIAATGFYHLSLRTNAGAFEGGTDTTLAGGVLLGAIFPSKNEQTPDLGTSLINDLIDGGGTAKMSASFGLTLQGTGNSTVTNLTASINPNNDNYLFKQLGNSPDNSRDGVVSYTGTPSGFTYINFQALQTSILGQGGDQNTAYNGIGSGSVLSVADIIAGTDLSFENGIGTEKYNFASTPFIRSQKLGVYPNKTTKQLFKFHTLMHGTTCNKDYKISIANLREPGDIDNVEQYSTFSVLVRKFDDTDKSPVILEQFNNCNLDPESANYISRVIGDRFPQYNESFNKVELKGNYPNRSDFIRVEVSPDVEAKSTSPKLSPKGFSAIINPISTASINFQNGLTFPSASYEGVQQIGSDNTYNVKGFLGWKFVEKDRDNENFIKPLPLIEDSNVSGEFNIEDYQGHVSSGLWTESLSASIDAAGQNGPAPSQLKFTVPFQGGQDGIAPHTVVFTGAETSDPLPTNYTNGTNLYGFDLSATNKAGYKGYKKAIDILSNQDEYDINMLVLPGVIKQRHSGVTQAGIDMCESRGDCFYVMDLAQSDATVNQAVGQAEGTDTNYAAVYYPWVKVLDTSVNRPILVPPSVIVPGAIAASDRIAAEWFAPAGLNRGVLGNVIEAKIRLNQNERDRLYDAKINPIATFPATGVCIWGQKTLQERTTALNRINVRRLLIALKKFIASSSRYLVFEQNTQATRNRFLNIVNPYLESVQQRQGLFAFRVVMDESNNTPDVIDRNQLIGAIYVQPAKTAEFIVLDFNILPTGATFDTGGGAGGY
jgi:phage tail sheath protein FI